MESLFVVWLVNLVLSTKLFGYLWELGFGATGKARINCGICVDFVAKKPADAKSDDIP